MRTAQTPVPARRLAARRGGLVALGLALALALDAGGLAHAQVDPKDGAKEAPKEGSEAPAAPVSAPAPAAPAPAAGPAPVASPPAPAPDPRRIERVTLPDGRTVVIAEGEFEPRSTGSYTVRLYGAGDPAFAFDRYMGGTVQPRDGTVERVLLQDLDRDGRPELVVVVRSAGSGGYLSADAWSFGDRRIARRASVADLPPGADPAAALAPRVRRATAP
ncbi:MAG: hypothetical protein RJA99_1482 [Pseudomonadota bacterium]|jgi:hypothetical protein